MSSSGRKSPSSTSGCILQDCASDGSEAEEVELKPEESSAAAKVRHGPGLRPNPDARAAPISGIQSTQMTRALRVVTSWGVR